MRTPDLTNLHNSNHVPRLKALPDNLQDEISQRLVIKKTTCSIVPPVSYVIKNHAIKRLDEIVILTSMTSPVFFAGDATSSTRQQRADDGSDPG